MSDLAFFRANRSIRRAMPPADRILEFRWGNDEFGPLLNELITLVAEGVEDLPGRAAAAATTYLYPDGGASARVDPDVLAASPTPVVDDQGNGPLWLLAALDRWLTGRDNQPDPTELEAEVARLFEAIGHDPLAQQRFLPAFFAEAWRRLGDTLSAALLLPTEASRAQRVNRLLAVAGLLRVRSDADAPFESGERIRTLLRLRPVVLPSPPFPHVLPPARVQLVRQASVADLWVVRDEWRCYVAGELADIRNVMPRETLEFRTVRLDEREITRTEEEEQITVGEVSTESSEESEFSESARREISLAIQGEAQVETSGQYGPTKVESTIAGSVDFSLSDASERATHIARQAVSRAASRVENRVRTERVERLLTRFEETHSHGFRDGADAVRGVYRWVDRVDRLQMFRYPDRFQLEFQFPEPGRFLRAQLSQPTVTGSLADPGEFSVTAADITRETWLDLAAEYEAVGVGGPPDQRVSVAAAVAVDSPSTMPSSNTAQWNAPAGNATGEIGIPPGYKAVRATVSVNATPILANWRRELEQSGGFQDLEGFHSIATTVAVGEKRWTDTHAGSSGSNSVQNEGTADGEVQYVQALLGAGHSEDLDPPLVGRASVVLTASGASAASAAVELECVVTDEAFGDWQQSVLEALITAHQASVREYRAERQRLGLDGRPFDERSPARHEEMIREELKRQVVSWLLGTSSFQGVDAVGAEDPDVNIGNALAAAPVIQFLEQAFEWTNLVHVAYPYYWARRGQWADIERIETVDPELGRFLRAGSVRVIVPARPGFSEAVEHWLIYQQPWGGGAPPVPGDPMYVSVAAEIRDLTEPPRDGEPGESWEVRLPTTLRWLDPSGDLPKNPLGRLGQAPWEPLNPLCPADD